MRADLDLELRMAVAAGRAMAVRSGAVPARAVSLETEARVNRLLALTLGMFGFAVGVVVVVGMLLF